MPAKPPAASKVPYHGGGRVLLAHIDPSPLRVGATADEAWTYIHTNSPALAPPGTSALVEEQSDWRAGPQSIQHQTRLYWRAKRFFAERQVIYVVNTNGVIGEVRTHWKFTWPF